MTITDTTPWHKLATCAREVPALPALLGSAERAQRLQFSLGECHFDFARQRVDATTVATLLELAATVDLPKRAEQMLTGAVINESEERQVLHSALRGGAQLSDPRITKDVAQVAAQQRRLAHDIRSGVWRGYSGKAITDVVHIGIGGSHLGPELITTALRDYHNAPQRIHFVANIDGDEIRSVLHGLNAETTLFVVVSKSFGTLETRVNATTARAWLLERCNDPQQVSKHFLAVSANVEQAVAFGIAPDNILPMWDWVGGRFSLWSAVGLPILISIGEQNFDALLAGARLADEHLANAPVNCNIPMLSALFATWNYNFLGASSHAILGYDSALALLPDYLQQLEMESNGKSVTQAGHAVDFHTMPILWGGTGTTGQHAYHQLLHQGTRAYTADFIVAVNKATLIDHHEWLVANAFAQGQAMAMGNLDDDPPLYRQVPGNHPTTTILLDTLSPSSLGTLLAVYEHKVFCQGAIWDINSFDQWGVELGKSMALPIQKQLAGEAEASGNDAATQQLIDYMRTQSTTKR